MLIIGADISVAGEFFRIPISGLCPNTTYEFSSWLINLMPADHHACGTGVGIPVNVGFEIWNSTDTVLLKSGDTGDINNTSDPTWEQFALVFQTRSNQTSVILKMRNNGTGGCGNDLAIDDIVFKTCGDLIIVEDALGNTNTNLCEDEVPFSIELTAVPDFAVFSSHFYQWQESTDGITWLDIPGDTNQNYTTPFINTTSFYRVKVAENSGNVNNSLCNTISDVFEIRVVPFPDAPVSNGDLLVCENDPTPLSVTVPNSDIIVNWYDDNGNLRQANSTTFHTMVPGIYYAETETVNGGCLSRSRTALEIDFFEKPQIEDETLGFCENTDITLYADTNIATSYLWNTGQTTENITVSTPGTYTVNVANRGCIVTKTIRLTQIDNPIIGTIESDGKDIIITTLNTGDYMYSLDGNIFQTSNTFVNIDGGLYTVYVKERHCDKTVITQHLHFYLPKYFTPNNDGVNDTFSLVGIEFYNSSQVSIFDRYGKLIKNSKNAPFSWNGTFNNQPLPTGDYWYVIVVDNQKITGHFTLKR